VLASLTGTGGGRSFEPGHIVDVNFLGIGFNNRFGACNESCCVSCFKNNRSGVLRGVFFTTQPQKYYERNQKR
jgi:hypothetical protein